MYRSRASRLTGALRMAALLTLTTAAACGDGGPTETPGRPGGGPAPVDPTTQVASVEITPGTLQLPLQGSRALSATVRNPNGGVLAGRVPRWTSSDSTVVRVDINGNATALRVGTAVVYAAVEGRQGQATIEVVPPAAPASVATVHVLGDVAGLEPGESRQLSARLRAANGDVLEGRTVTWSSSDSTVVRVFPGGEVLGLKGGTATITATSEGKSGSVTVLIPQWLQFRLQSVDANGLPAVVAFSADTTERTEFAIVVKERRVRAISGRLWISTVDSRYRQRYDLQTWEREVTIFAGSAIIGEEKLVEARAILDEGDAELYDVWTGQAIYESWTFAGHSFRVETMPDRGRWIRQLLPGEGGAVHELAFAK